MKTLSREPNVRELEALVKKASVYYFNKAQFLKVRVSDYPSLKFLLPNSSDLVTINDAVFDGLEAALRKLNPNSPALRVGAPVNPKKKVELPYPMWSLDKQREESIGEWLSSHKGPYVLSDKEDGQSLLLVYKKGQPVQVYTRGTPTEGHDVTYLAPHLNIPQKLGRTVVIRGEAIISRSAFEAFEDKWENARNMVAGLMNRKEPAKELKAMDVLGYSVYEPRVKISKGFELLKSLGFKTAPYKIYDKLTPNQLEQVRQKRRGSSKHEVDGLVIAQDVPYEFEDRNPTFMVAFKKLDASGSIVTKVKEVVWELSRYGYWKPRVNIEPIRLAGVTVSYATAHNAKYIVDNKIGPGAQIEVTRSGDVIPYIVRVVKGTKAQLPPKGEWEWNATKVDFVHPKARENEAAKSKALAAFFSILGAAYVGRSTTEKMIDIGLDTPAKILKATPRKFVEMDGVQERTAIKVYKSIQDAWKNANLPLIMAASAVFGRNFGYERLATIVGEIPTILTLSKSALSTAILEVPGIKETLANQFIANMPAFKTWLKTMPVSQSQLKYEEEHIEQKSSKLSGKVFVFTGFRDDGLEHEIQEHGGEIASGVNAHTTAVLAKDPSSSSGKVQKARELNIPVLTVAEFRKRFKI